MLPRPAERSPTRQEALVGRGSAGRTDTFDRTLLMLTVCVWGAHFVLVAILIYLTSDRPSDPSTLAMHAMACAVGVGLCMAAHVLLRRSGETRPWPLLAKAAGLSLPLCVILAFTRQLAAHLTPFYEFHPEQWLDPYFIAWGSIDFLWILLTWAALFVGATVVFEIRRRDSELIAMRDAAQQAQLRALRSQINPHFLFNTLNTLAGYIVLDRRQESERMVLNLSRFLRHTLARMPSRLVRLSDEIDMLRRYLEIETARFGDRLAPRYDIPSRCDGALVPGLILLPLAENSIKYALAGSEDGITIRVGARREGDTLVLWLQDDGASHAQRDKGLGIGLSNTRQQLAALYGEDARFEAGPEPGGWRNVLRIPWREGTA